MTDVPLIGVKKCAVCGGAPARLWQQEDGRLVCHECNTIGLLMALHQKVNVLGGAVDGLIRAFKGQGDPIQ